MSNTGILKKSLSKLLGAVAKTKKLPLRLSVDEWKSDFGEVYLALKKLDLFKPAESAKQVLCPNCHDHFVDVIFQNKKAYAVCDGDDSIGRMLIDASQLSQERLDFEGFLQWTAKACGLQDGFAEVEAGWAWRLGALGKTDAPVMVYCARTVDIDEAVDFLGRLNDPKAVVLWLGEKPAVGQYPDNILSLLDLISVSAGELKVKKTLLKLFQDEKVFAQSGDIELDKHIVLRQKKGKCFLLLNKKGNGFEKEVPIRPQMYRIIQAAYGVRKKDPWGLRLFEYCHPRNISQNERTISTRINELKKLCEDQGIKQILTKDNQDCWGLNRVLGCCK